MIDQLKKLILLIGLLSLGLCAQAQDKKFSTAATMGITTPFLDNGIGLHLGLNPAYRLTARLTAEGQLSYLYTDVNSSFLSGDETTGNAVNALAGGRLYLNKEKKKNRFYLNCLLGLNYNKEEANGVSRAGEFSPGLSTGAYAQLNKILIGLSYDTPQNFVLRFGWIF
ncbi:MAG: hypothetical protein MRZ79_25835 [Bacteroidia bacterium]|nr:hypothetical protein [Bacteroidia bacterium]